MLLKNQRFLKEIKVSFGGHIAEQVEEKLNKGLLSAVIVIGIVVLGMIVFFVLNYEELISNKNAVSEPEDTAEEIVEVIEAGEVEPVEVESEIELEKSMTVIPDKDRSSDLPNKMEVYEYAQSLFNRVTNYGENYNPEIHDDMVIRQTAEHFGIDYQTADKLYLEGASNSY